MFASDDGGRYAYLSDIVEVILSRCNDDSACIARELEGIEPQTRYEILSSDLLNAWQVFWYFFRDDPGEDAVEYLMFHPAGELGRGVPMGEFGLYILEFTLSGGEPEIRITDDIQEVTRFRGANAWQDARQFLSGED